MPSSPPTAGTTLQTLSLPFTLSKQRSGIVTISIEPDNNPSQYGHQLIFPDQNLDNFLGFPECHAKVQSTGLKGYGSIYGWIQMVRSTDSDDKWEMDPIPLTKDLNTPFVWFGPEPSLFDGPSRFECKELDWSCRSFLTYVEDGVISKDVIPILGFEWGFWVKDGEVFVKALREVGLDVWDGHLGLLRSQFEGWKFRDSQGREC